MGTGITLVDCVQVFRSSSDLPLTNVIQSEIRIQGIITFFTAGLFSALIAEATEYYRPDPSSEFESFIDMIQRKTRLDLGPIGGPLQAT